MKTALVSLLFSVLAVPLLAETPLPRSVWATDHSQDEIAAGEKLTHFAMLIAARHWTQQVIWSLHDKNAVESGLKPEILDALASGRRTWPAHRSTTARRCR